MSYETATEEILAKVGGLPNVTQVQNCATRLRLTLKDLTAVDAAGLEAMPEVLGTVNTGRQYHIVIGNDVPKYRQEVVRYAAAHGVDFAGGAVPPQAVRTLEERRVDAELMKERVSGASRAKSVASAVLNYIAGAMSPLLPALVGSGILKGFLAVAVAIGLLDAKSSTYVIFAGISSAVFTFLPILVAFTAARTLGVNEYIAATIGAALMAPTITALVTSPGKVVDFLGIPAHMFDYSSTLFPSLVAIWVYSYADKWLNRVVHKDFKMLVIPFVGLVVFVPFTLLVLGPLAYYISQGISVGYTAMFDFSPILTGLVIGAVFSFLVLFGIHWAFIPIMITAIATTGVSSLFVLAGASNLAAISLPLGILLWTKVARERTIAGGLLFTAIFSGVTEPIMFGYVLRNKRFVAPLVITGATIGAAFGFFNAEAHGFALLSLFALPLLTANGSTLLFAILAVGGLVLGAIVTRFFLFSRKAVQERAEEAERAA
ncbi:PTS transporter subunit EIIC [Frondihabitans cladoniiphilus]|uniref:PTS system beta-glucosides-specific IIC component n=1 Tax=Frondihabitans cladoniiphilus TaxID=715785 RepID=A0ABP8VHU5_9MICO